MAQRNAFQEALDNVKRLASNAGGLAGGIGNALQTAGNYFNPKVGVVQKPLISPIQGKASPVPQVRSFWTDIPQVNPNQIIENIPKVYNQVGGDIIKATPLGPGLNYARNTLQNSTFAKSPLGQFAGDLTNTFVQAPSNYVQGMMRGTAGVIEKNPQKALGGYAQAGSAALNFVPIGAGGQVGTTLLKQGFGTSIKHGAILGGTYGGLQGFLNGLDKNRNKTIGEQLKNAGLEGLIGAGTGVVLGGALGAGSNLLKQWVTKTPEQIAQDILKLHPEWTEKQARDEAGRWIANTTHGLVGKKALPQFTVGPDRLTEAESNVLKSKYGLKIEPSIGLNVKQVTPEEGAAIRKLGSANLAEQTGLKSPSLAASTTEQGGQDLSKTAQSSNIQKSLGGELTSDQVPPSSDGSISQDPVQKIINALKQAKPLEAKQAKIYAEARSKQAGAIAGIGKSIPGEAGFHAQLGQLKGDLPKVQFESLRSQFQQPEVDSLFNKIEQSNLSPFEKITAKSGLAKLLGAEGGSVPVRSELEVLNQIFPPEFTQAVLEKRPLFQKLVSLGQEALNIPRAMQATLDFSAPLRQGFGLIGRPKQWIPAFRDMFKYAFNEEAYQGLLDNIKTRPTYAAMRDAKLALTDMSPILTSREEQFMSQLPNKLPIFGRLAKGSERAYSGFLNKLRADTFDDLYKSAQSQGLLKDNQQVVHDIAKFVNTATGRGDLGAFQRAAPILNAAFFSPRLMASRVQTLNPNYYIKLDPFVRKEAIKSLLAMAGTASTIIGLAKLGGADVGTDPRSADFGKIKVGNTRFDLGGGFLQYLVLGSRLLSGKIVSSTTGREVTLGEGFNAPTRADILGNFLKSKEAPVLSFITQVFTGTDSAGNPINVPAQVVDEFIPMFLQDVYDLTQEHGPMGVAMAIPGMFGVGSQTYGRMIPNQTTTPSGKPKIEYNNPPSIGGTIINKVTGQQESNIPVEQQAPLAAKHLQEQKDKAELDTVKRDVMAKGGSKSVKDKIVYKVGNELKTLDISLPLPGFETKYGVDGIAAKVLEESQYYNPDSTLGKQEALKYVKQLKANPKTAVALAKQSMAKKETSAARTAAKIKATYSSLPVEQRKQYLQNLKDKNILTPEVLKYFKKP